MGKKGGKLSQNHVADFWPIERNARLTIEIKTIWIHSLFPQRYAKQFGPRGNLKPKTQQFWGF